MYGVVNYDLDVIENLEIFDTYDEAYARYLELLLKDPYPPPKDLWVVFIQDNRIVQLDQLRLFSKCKIIGGLDGQIYRL